MFSYEISRTERTHDSVAVQDGVDNTHDNRKLLANDVSVIRQRTNAEKNKERSLECFDKSLTTRFIDVRVAYSLTMR